MKECINALNAISPLEEKPSCINIQVTIKRIILINVGDVICLFQGKTYLLAIYLLTEARINR